MKISLLLSIVLFAIAQSYAQNRSNIEFIGYMIDRGNFDEALFLIEKEFNTTANYHNDSLNYYNGWANYSLQKLEESSLRLLKVRQGSVFYSKSHFFAGYNQSHLGNYKQAKSIFSQIQTSSPTEKALQEFQLSGIFLLEGDIQQAKKYLHNTNSSIPVINRQVITLEHLAHEIEQHRPKKPWLAGAMSAVIPGSGKFYAGKKGEGVANFLGTVSFGAIAWENYRKLGLKNAKTIIFGGIFAATYVSNIYGSAMSVKIQETEYQNAIHNQILFQLHIPLRNYFE